MESLFDNQLWTRAQTDRKRQKFTGRISGFFLLIALVALFDGLLAQMRAGSNELDILCGNSLTVSGPAVLKNPVSSDLKAVFTPQTSPLAFELEGFFSGYWFGNGMWRGLVIAPQDTPPGEYKLDISFRGASAQTIQRYIVKVFANAAAMRAASLSFFKRWLGLNPFLAAVVCGGAGILFGLITYFFGCRYARSLLGLGLSQIYRHKDNGSLWCFADASLAPRKGNTRMIVDERGQLLGEARAEGWQKGRLHMQMLDGAPLPPSALVCLKPPEIANKSAVQTQSTESEEDK